MQGRCPPSLGSFGGRARRSEQAKAGEPRVPAPGPARGASPAGGTVLSLPPGRDADCCVMRRGCGRHGADRCSTRHLAAGGGTRGDAQRCVRDGAQAQRQPERRAQCAGHQLFAQLRPLGAGGVGSAHVRRRGGVGMEVHPHPTPRLLHPAERPARHAATTSQSDIDAGILNVLIGFAPLKPAEFVIITIRQLFEKKKP